MRGWPLWGAMMMVALVVPTCDARAAEGNKYEMRIGKSQDKRMKKTAALTLEDAVKAIIISDDPFEPAITFSSEEVFASPRSLSENVLGESCFRAFVDRETGKARFQLYQTISYVEDWRRFDQVNIMMPDGLRTMPLTRIDDELRDCYAVNFYGREETVGFDLSEADMEAIAAIKPGPDGDPAILRFRFKSPTSFDWTDDIPAIEAQAMLVALNNWREARGL
ncbi:MAG: hypothetical protein R3E04_10930 [Sphingobium sp.]